MLENITVWPQIGSGKTWPAEVMDEIMIHKWIDNIWPGNLSNVIFLYSWHVQDQTSPKWVIESFSHWIIGWPHSRLIIFDTATGQLFLAGELRKLWQVKVKVVPVVVGALGTIPKALEKHLKEIGTSVRVQLLQKAALLGTARILQKTLEI